MEIENFLPKCNIVLLKNVEWDNNYEDTVIFDTTGDISSSVRDYYLEQRYFIYMSRAKYGKIGGPLKVALPAEKVMECNYIVVQNTNWSKFFWCGFITKVEYENIGLSTIYWEIDIFQTFIYHTKFNNCYIEREHVSDDRIGVHTLDENLQLGEYVYSYRKDSGIYAKNDPLFPYVMYAVVWATEPPNQSPLRQGQIIGGVFQGAKPYYFDVTDPNGSGVKELQETLYNYAKNGKQDAVVSINMIPDKIANYGNPVPKNYDFNIVTSFTSFGSYHPKNNKLYTYPYQALLLTNGTTQSQTLHYELLNSSTLHVSSVDSPVVQCICYPDYKGQNKNIMYSVSINSFPQCSYTVDSYQAWIAQNSGFQQIAMERAELSKASAERNAVTGAIASGGALAASLLAAPSTLGGSLIAAAPSAMGLFNSVAGGMENVENAELSIKSVNEQNKVAMMMPDVAKGSNVANVVFADSKLDFTTYRAEIREEYAKAIDQFFTMYGYKVNELKTPKLTNRMRYKYLKMPYVNMINVNISESTENYFSYQPQLKKIFMKGTRMWRYVNHDDPNFHFGNFELDNPIRY